MFRNLSGNTIAVINFIFWGLLPLYYQYVNVDDIFELFSVRILASLPCLWLAFILFKEKLPSLASIWQKKRSCVMIVLSSAFISVSWCTFTYAITNGHVMEASLGFFIAPLFAIAFGVFIQHDGLDIYKGIAIILAIAGVGYQIVVYKQVPVTSLIMALTFSLYGLCKKYTDFDMLFSLTLETLVIAPFAAIYLCVIDLGGNSQLANTDGVTWALFLGAAPMTLIPYFLYTAAVRKTSLTMIGLLHYIEPSLQFCLALLYFHEPFDHVKAISFGLIWSGLLIFSFPAVVKVFRQRKSKAVASVSQ